MAPPTAQRAPSTSAVKLLLIAMAAVVLLGGCFFAAVAIIAGGGAFAVLRGTTALIEATTPPECAQFLADLRVGAVSSAYAKMSPTYRAGRSLEQFAAAVAARPELAAQTGLELSHRSIVSNTATMSGAMTTPTGPVPIEFSLSQAQTGNAWVIESVTIGGTPL